jgi:transposase
VVRGKVSKYPVRLKRKQRRWLESVVRRRVASHWLVERARILLLSAELKRVQLVAAALSVDRQRVRRWRKRFCEEGVHALKDRARRGRPVRIAAKVWQKVAALVVQEPRKFGLPTNRWTLRDIAWFLKHRYGWCVSRSHLSRFLRSMALRPHRIRYWLNPRDPEFDKKAARICRLYVRPPRKTTVLSLDEKPGVPVRSRRHPTRPIQPGKPARVEFEYRRHGTRTVFAAFNIKTGRVLVRVTRDRKLPRLLEFLELIVKTYRRGPIIIITDNVTNRRVEATKSWLRRHPRVAFVFTPIHGSWLNQVEIWFSILTQKCLRWRSFNSGRQLAAAVYAFARRWNDVIGHPFAWTYTGKVLHV